MQAPAPTNDSSLPVRKISSDEIDYGDGIVLPVFSEPMKEHRAPSLDALIEHAEYMREWVVQTPEQRRKKEPFEPFVM